MLPKSGSSIDVTADTAQNLVQNVLISGCLQASNITFAGDSAQIGRFYRASDNPDFPLESGIIIATGQVVAAEGPNGAGNTTTEYTSTGDSDLQSMAGYDTNDRAVLTLILYYGGCGGVSPLRRSMRMGLQPVTTCFSSDPASADLIPTAR